MISSIQDVVWKYLPLFHARITSILEDGYRNNSPESRVVLELSAEARSNWLNFYNNVEADMATGSFLCDIRDAASKIAETAVRISALFHFFEGRSGQIQADTFEQARQLSSWYLCEFKRIFGQKQRPPQEQMDAQLLEAWFWEVYAKSGVAHFIRKNYVRQYAPNCLRSKNRINGALWELARCNKITLGVSGKTEVVYPNPNYWVVQTAQFPQTNYPAVVYSQPQM